MASNVRRPQPPPPAGGFEDYLPDDLADYDGLFGDEQPGIGQSGKSQKKGGDATAGLGIDEEVDVKKRVREPRVKLDELRCVSAASASHDYCATLLTAQESSLPREFRLCDSGQEI